MSVLEAKVEAELVRRARAMGFLCYKLDQIPGSRNNPDQLLINPARECVFVEVKRKNLEPRPAQLAEHRFLRDKNQHVEVIDCTSDIDEVLAMYIK